MKNKFILLITTLILCINSILAEEGKVTFGLEVAPAVTWLNIKNDQISSAGSSLKLNGGLNAYFNLDNNYAISTGLKLNTYGGELEGTVSNVSETVKYEFQEVEIPVGLKLRTGSFGNFRFAAHLGVGCGIMIKSKATKEGFYEDKHFDNYSLFPVRALYNLGVGTEYNVGAAILTARINYKGWFSNLYFYNNGIGNPTKQLDFQTDTTPLVYDKKVIFQPSALEFVIGVLF